MLKNTTIQDVSSSKKWLEDWRYDIIKHDLQRDGSSCGVHVIEVKIVYSFVRKKTLTKTGHLVKYYLKITSRFRLIKYFFET